MHCSGKEFIVPCPFRDRILLAFALTKDTADHAGSGLIFKGSGGSFTVSTAHSVAWSTLN